MKLKPNLPWIGMAVLFAGLFGAMWGPLVSVWADDGNYSHGFLVPLVSLYLIWTKRSEFHSPDARPARSGLVLLSVGLLMTVLGFWGGIDILQRVSAVVVINSIVLYNFGPHVYRRLLFPLLFLFLMIPIPVTIYTQISFPLQLWATTASRWVVDILGAPVTQAGNILTIKGIPLEVAEACSGIRSLLTFVTLGCLLAYFFLKRWGAQAALLASAVPIALATNILRIVLTAFLISAYGPGAAEGTLHESIGLAVFVIGFGLFVGEAFLLARWTEASDRSAP